MPRSVFRFVVAGFAIVLVGFASATDANDNNHRKWVLPEFKARGLDEDPALELKHTAPPQPDDRAIVEAVLVVQEGDTPLAGVTPVSWLGAPTTNGNGKVGFTGGIAGIAENFVWFDTGITWLNSDGFPDVLAYGGNSIGISDSGGFIYSPQVNGNESVWTQNGLLLTEGAAAPGYAPPTFVTSNSWPQMLPNGQAYWIAGLNMGGTSTDAQVLYTSVDGTPATIAPILQSGDMVGGYPIAGGAAGLRRQYQISDNALHHIHLVNLETSPGYIYRFVYVDGAWIAGDGSPTGGGDNWDFFDTVSINDVGDYLFSGETDGSSAIDEFVAYNGVIAVREGDTIGGINLASSATVRAVSINNFGHAAHIWNHGGGGSLFFSCDAADLYAGSTLVLTSLDEVDLDANGSGDATVGGFNASAFTGPGLWLAEDGMVYVEVYLVYGSVWREAIIVLDLPSCGMPIFADGFETGSTVAWSSVFP